MNYEREDLLENIIREAINSEIESIDTPAIDRAWKKIEHQLNNTRTSSARSIRFHWSRAAVLAAACLVIVLGGIGIFYNIQTAVPLADSYAPAETVEDVGILTFEDEAEETFTLEADDRSALPEPLPDQVIALSEPDPSPPDWSETLDGDYSFGQALLLPEAEEPLYRGAIYYSDDVDLLHVKSKETITSVQVFLDQLEEYMNFSLENVREINGFISFTVEERPGLAWKDNGHSQALLVLSGYLVEDELAKIASGLNH